MSARASGATPLAVLCALTVASASHATMMRKFTLKDLAESADRVFRGKVIGISTTTVRAGGGELPVTVYRLRVDERFKGSFAAPKGEPVMEVRMVGTAKPQGPVNGLTRVSVFRDVPHLEMDGEYVLFTTRPSRIGLSTTVGLGQGAFRIDPTTKHEATVNGFGNMGLDEGLPPSGAVPYTRFAEAIRSALTRVRP